MAGSINKVILVGNVGNDPEIRATQDGRKIANLSIATSDSWKDKNTGERREKTEWHRVSVFNEGLVNVIENYVNKGSKLYIEGALQTRKWQDRDGNDKYTTEVVLQGYNGNLTMLDNKGSGGGASQGGGYNQGQQSGGNYGAPQGGGNAPAFGQTPAQGAAPQLDDEIPF